MSVFPSKPQDPVCVISLFRFIKLYVLPEKSGKMKTTVKKNTTNPVYNEVLKVQRKMLVVMSVNLVLNYKQFSVWFSQYHIERHLLFGKRLQASVWHSGILRRKEFLGEVLIPLDGWRFEDKASRYFNWYPLCPKVKRSRGTLRNPVVMLQMRSKALKVVY